MSHQQLDEEAVFHVARGIDDHVLRTTYLDQICAGDQPLRERVEALLEVHEQEQSFLSSNAAPEPTVDHSAVAEQPGQQIGRYKLLQKIGEGGFGVVYMAEQSRPVRRKVALKIIKPGMDTKAVVARFEAERQALALMDHSNIARVLDGGATDSGRPYFVMELVNGVPITEYCDTNQLSTEDRLLLFVDVCRAVQHAHQKAIIHRDLKPSNVLVTLADGQPVVKVIDFGIAKAVNQRLTEKTLFTAYGQMIGTPQYMSPEQAEMSCLDVDTRSDVYSLGVILYELLTGATPLDDERLHAAGYAEIQRLIQEDEPQKPSTRLSSSGDRLAAIAKQRSLSPEQLERALRGDLDWIVMRTLEKDRSRRYESPSSLAQDLEKHLGNEPVDARPPTYAYRIGKYLRRNRFAISVAALVFITLNLGLVGTTWQAVVANQQRQKAARTLLELQGVLTDRALADALAGDVEACEFALSRAEEAGARGQLVDLIRALAWMYGGRLPDAIEALKLARSETGDRPALLAALFLAYAEQGDFQKFHELSDALAKATSDADEQLGDRERLLIAHARSLATRSPSRVVEEVNGIVSRNPRWGVAYATRAMARTRLATETKKTEDILDACSDAMLAKGYHPDNAFVLTCGMRAYVGAIDIARFHHLPHEVQQQIENEANVFAEALKEHPNYLFGMVCRAVYLSLTDRRREHQEVYAQIHDRGWGGDQSIVARSLGSHNARKEIEALKSAHPDSFSASVALGVLEVLEGTADVDDAIEGLSLKFFHLNQRWLMLDIALLAQRPRVARKWALRFQDEMLKSDDFSSSHYLDETLLGFYAGTVNEEQLKERSYPFAFERTVAAYAIGMWKLGSAAPGSPDFDEAKKQLAIAADCPVPGVWHAEFAKVYLRLLDEGRIPAATTSYATKQTKGAAQKPD